MLSLHSPRGESTDIRLDAIERRIVRNALNYYQDGLERQAKGLEKASLSAEEPRFVLAAINGSDGFGTGIYAKLREPGDEGPRFGDQVDLEDEIDAAVSDEARAAFEAECRTIQEGLLSRPEWPEGGYGDALLIMVRSWSPNDRAAVTAWLAAGEGEEPEVAAAARQRVLELLLSPDEVAQWAAQGPWEVASDTYDDSTVPYFYALRADIEPVRSDDVDFDREEAAMRRVAWLNRAETAVGVVVEAEEDEAEVPAA